MDEHQWLAEQFEANRSHLQAVAYRMLGSLSEANDAVQEAWLHLSRSDASRIGNLGGWLTTVVARICLDRLRSRKSRPEASLDVSVAERMTNREAERSSHTGDPEQEALLADSVGLALLVVLNTLNPAERLAFVLHDLFAMPFDEIAAVLERSEAATRKLASRARRRVQGTAIVKNADLAGQREVVNAFLAASREGSFEALLAVLDPEVVFRADSTAMSLGASGEIRGAAAVAKFFSGRAHGARLALVNGAVGLLVGRSGRPRLVLNLTITAGKIVAIEAVADPARLNQLRLSVLDNVADQGLA